MKVQEENNEVQEEAPFSIPNFPKNGNVDSPHYFLVVPVVQMDFAFSFASNLTLLPTPSAIAPTTISLHNRFVTLAISERHTTTATTTAPPTYNQHTTKAPKWRRKRKELESEMENGRGRNGLGTSFKYNRGSTIRLKSKNLSQTVALSLSSLALSSLALSLSSLPPSVTISPLHQTPSSDRHHHQPLRSPQAPPFNHAAGHHAQTRKPPPQRLHSRPNSMEAATTIFIFSRHANKGNRGRISHLTASVQATTEAVESFFFLIAKLSASGVIRKKVLLHIVIRWRDFKTRLTRLYIFGDKQHENPCQHYTFTKEEWMQFRASRESEEWKGKRLAAQERQRLSDAPHLLSRGGYAKLEKKIRKSRVEALELEFPDLAPAPARYELWKASRTKFDGNMTSSLAALISQRIDELVEQQTQGKIVGQSKDDILTMAIGKPEHPRRHVRATIDEVRDLQAQFTRPQKQPMHEPVIDEDDEMAEAKDDPLSKLMTRLPRYMNTIVVDQGRSFMYKFVEPQTIQASGNTLESKQY
ncbi:hypothetical protein LR48_Vigan04g036500 [Vigna angularis]|uniref:Uncharacterized protein n=1 Tax=Phaseolus angularis TaxID=3914 RepID=A0A0L9UC85_PHAAN|nr:hypothetical protein LR48_Vigan04g036500 [Vigna angularis]